MIILVIAGGNGLPYCYKSDGIVVGKGYEPPQEIGDQNVLSEHWWVDVYCEQEQYVGRVYLNRRIWAKTHVGDEWWHGLNGYE